MTFQTSNASTSKQKIIVQSDRPDLEMTSKISTNKKVKVVQTSFNFQVVSSPPITNPNTTIGRTAEPYQAIYPNLVTLGKIVRGGAPHRTLAVMDGLENKYGKLALFSVEDIFGEALPPLPPLTSKRERRSHRSLQDKTISRLLCLGLIEGATVGAKPCYRLTSEARRALQYI